MCWYLVLLTSLRNIDSDQQMPVSSHCSACAFSPLSRWLLRADVSHLSLGAIGLSIVRGKTATGCLRHLYYSHIFSSQKACESPEITEICEQSLYIGLEASELKSPVLYKYVDVIETCPDIHKKHAMLHAMYLVLTFIVEE